jgi:hypothetical protein
VHRKLTSLFDCGEAQLTLINQWLAVEVSCLFLWLIPASAARGSIPVRLADVVGGAGGSVRGRLGWAVPPTLEPARAAVPPALGVDGMYLCGGS